MDGYTQVQENEDYLLALSDLRKTWIIDLDGTIFKHNGYKDDGYDTLLEGVPQLMEQIGDDDLVILLTARPRDYKEVTEAYLKKHGIRYDHLIYDVPVGERILINDRKPSGLKTAYALNTMRDHLPRITVSADM